MHLTTKGKYAVTALLDLSLNQTGGYTSIQEIALRQDISMAYLEQLFRNPNAPSFFNVYSGQNNAMRYKKIVDEGQIEPANFDHIRGYVKDKEVDQYLLHSRPLNKIFQSLYQEEVGGFSLDDLLNKNKYNRNKTRN